MATETTTGKSGTHSWNIKVSRKTNYAGEDTSYATVELYISGSHPDYDVATRYYASGTDIEETKDNVIDYLEDLITALEKTIGDIDKLASNLELD